MVLSVSAGELVRSINEMSELSALASKRGSTSQQLCQGDLSETQQDSGNGFFSLFASLQTRHRANSYRCHEGQGGRPGTRTPNPLIKSQLRGLAVAGTLATSRLAG